MGDTVECKPILLHSLNPAEIKPYKKLILPEALPLLETNDPGFLPVGIEARINGKPVGLIISHFSLEQKSGQIYSLVVAKPFRRKGIATYLFQMLQEYLIKHLHCTVMGFNLRAGSPEEIPMQKILARFDWPKPKIYFIRCRFLLDDFNPPWFQEELNKPKPKGFRFFSLNKLKGADKKSIAHDLEQGVFQPNLSPLLEKESMSPLNSLGVRYRHKVIGWCVTHRVDPQTIRYSSLYMEKEFHSIGIRLLAESIRLQKEQSKLFPKAVCHVIYQESDLSWWLFVHKRLIPYADETEKLKWAMKFFPSS